MNGHGNERCWKLHPKLCPKKDKEVMQTNVKKATCGKEDTDIDPKATFKAKKMQKENP